MTTEQRRALADTIPTTEVIRDAVTFPRDRLGEPLDISPERFEAWLTRVRRDAAREALDGLIDAAQREHDRAPAPYRYRFEKVVSIATEYRDTHYPEESP